VSEREARLLRIHGHVQGVGYRSALHAEACRLGLDGWVRNRLDGSVEALVAGAPASVNALVDWANRGPPAARVSHVVRRPARPPDAAGFYRKPTL